jgi:hypothetical protein
MRGSSVDDQHDRRVVGSPYHLGEAHQEVQDPVTALEYIWYHIKHLIFSSK